MEIAVFVKGLLVGFFASISLGPIGLIIIQRTLSKGRKSGFFSGLGASTGDTFWAVVAGFSLSFVIGFVEKQQFYFQLLGGLVLVFLGWRMFKTNPALQFRRARQKKTRLVEDYISVFLITISNPLIVFLFIAIFAAIGALNNTSGAIYPVLLVLGVFAGGVIWWFFLAYILDLFKSKVKLKFLWWLNKISGIIVICFGLIAVFSLFIHLGDGDPLMVLFKH